MVDDFQGMALNRGVWIETQATTRTELQGSVAGGRSHGSKSLDITLGMTGGDGVMEVELTAQTDS